MISSEIPGDKVLSGGGWANDVPMFLWKGPLLPDLPEQQAMSRGFLALGNLTLPAGSPDGRAAEGDGL